MSGEEVHCINLIGGWLGKRVGQGGVEGLAENQTTILHSTIIHKIFYSLYLVSSSSSSFRQGPGHMPQMHLNL
jgi:hypothetical protein